MVGSVKHGRLVVDVSGAASPRFYSAVFLYHLASMVPACYLFLFNRNDNVGAEVLVTAVPD